DRDSQSLLHKSPFSVSDNGMVSSAARRGQWHGAARRNEDQSAAGPSGHRPHARRSRATRRPVDAVGTERGVHWVWLRRRRSLGGLPWLAPRGEFPNTSEIGGGQGATASGRTRRSPRLNGDAPGAPAWVRRPGKGSLSRSKIETH